MACARFSRRCTAADSRRTRLPAFRRVGSLHAASARGRSMDVLWRERWLRGPEREGGHSWAGWVRVRCAQAKHVRADIQGLLGVEPLYAPRTRTLWVVPKSLMC